MQTRTDKLIDDGVKLLNSRCTTRLDLANHAAWVQEHTRQLAEQVGTDLARGHMERAATLSCTIADLCFLHRRIEMRMRQLAGRAA